MGECDLVLVHSKKYRDEGLDLHIRTTIKDDYSYIEAVALRLGRHVIEFHKQHIFVDGLQHKDGELPISIGDKHEYQVASRAQPNKDRTRIKKFYMIELGNDSSVELRFYRHFGSVQIMANPEDFGDAVGLSGTFPNGDMKGRTGSLIRNTEDFGFEWQVDPSHDPTLFLEMREPQLPSDKCRMPTLTRSSRRKLRRNEKGLYTQAKQACRAQYDQIDNLEACIDDVMATGDVQLGEEWM